MKSLSTSVVLLLMALTSQCTNDNTSGTTDHTPAVMGTLQFADGSPAEDQIVELRSRNTIAEPIIGGLSKRAATTISSTTDQSGKFVFNEAPEAGVFVVEALNNDFGILIDSVIIIDNGPTVTLPVVKLKPVGAIRGTLGFDNPTDTGAVFMLVFGLERFAEVNSDGTYIFPGLPPGKYDLRFITTVDDYAALDTGNIEVTAAETTVIKALQLHYIGIPVPQNLSLKYDTIQQRVVLSWTISDSSSVKEYAVFRRNVDSNTVFIGLDSLRGTTFIDTTCLQDFAYEYRVAAIGENSNTGPKSNSVTSRITSYFECDTQWTFGFGTGPGRFNSIDDVDISEEDELYFLDNENRMIQVYDTLMNCTKQISLLDIPDSPEGYISGICVGKSSNVFVTRLYDYFPVEEELLTLYRLSEDGSWREVYECSRFSSIDIADSLLYIATTDSSVEIVSRDGELLRTVQMAHWFERIHVCSSDRIAYIDRALSRLFTSDRACDNLQAMHIPGDGRMDDFTFDDVNLRLYIANSVRSTGPWLKIVDRLCVYDCNGSEIASYSIINNCLTRDWNRISVVLSKNKAVFLTVFPGIGCSEARVIKLKPLER